MCRHLTTNPGRPPDSRDGTRARLDRIGEIVAAARPGGRPGAAERGRNRLTRAVDRLIALAEPRAPWLVRWASLLVAVLLFAAALLLARTVRFASAGASQDEGPPAPSILALWHARAPALLVMLGARPFRGDTAILVADGPRGDPIATLCRWLGLTVVRGDDAHSGWAALSKLVPLIEAGARVLITVDGTGPAGVVKPGAAALADATGAPLVPLATACRPALVERQHWDRGRIPLPFGRVVGVWDEPVRIPRIEGAESLAEANDRLGAALDLVSHRADEAVGR
jgi:hypothetical protein